jgi:hypothetical protein
VASARRFREEAVRLHRAYQGKVEILPKVTIAGEDAFALWYTPGVAQPCLEIRDQPDLSFELTNRANSVAILTNGWLERIGGARSVGFGQERVRSLPDAFAVAIRMYLADRAGLDMRRGDGSAPAQPSASPDFCPHYHQATLIATGGCVVCSTCGFREC